MAGLVILLLKFLDFTMLLLFVCDTILLVVMENGLEPTTELEEDRLSPTYYSKKPT